MENKDLIRTLDRLYKCRDLEISNLWQRSIFLSAFLILCFTGYSLLASKIIDCTDTSIWLSMNLISIALAFVGCVLSVIWIYMAKGSKAWYEVYEKAITNFENENYHIIGIPNNNIMGEMGIPQKDLNNCIFSMKAGAYSPSRINILIGQVCFVGWIIIGIMHSIIIYFYMLNKDYTILNEPLVIYLFPVILGLSLVFLCWKFQTKTVRSKHLYNSIYGENGEFLIEREKLIKIRGKGLFGIIKK